MLLSCDVGDAPVVTFTHRDSTGTINDPTPTFTVVTRSPAGVETSYQYPNTTAITKTAVGVFDFTMPRILTGGVWYLRANGTGPVTASWEDEMQVQVSAYTTPLP